MSTAPEPGHAYLENTMSMVEEPTNNETEPEAPLPSGHADASALTEDQLYERLASEDLDELRVLFVMAQGHCWTWAVPDLADTKAVTRVVDKGLVLVPPTERLPYHVTDEGARKIHAWLRDILPVVHVERFGKLWFRVVRN